MSKVTDDALKKVSGGKALQDIGKAFGEAMWNGVGNVLIPLLDSLVVDPVFGKAAGLILQLLKDKGKGTYSAEDIISACGTLKGATIIQSNELALQHLQAIENFVKEC